MIECGGQPFNCGMAIRTLRRSTDMVGPRWRESIAGIGMAGITACSTGVVHGCGNPRRTYSMAAATGAAGHRRHRMRSSSGCRSASGRGTVMTGSTVGRTGDTCVRK